MQTFLLLVRIGYVMLQEQMNPAISVGSHLRLFFIHTTCPHRVVGRGVRKGSCSTVKQGPRRLRLRFWGITVCWDQGTETGELHMGISEAWSATFTCHFHIALVIMSHRTRNDSNAKWNLLCAPHTFEAASPTSENYAK